MNVLINKLTRGKKRFLVIYLITLLVYIISFSFFIKSILSLGGIESFIRYSVLIFFFLYFIFYFISNLFIIIQKYTKTYIFITIITYIFIIIFIIGSIFISGVYKIISFKDSNKIVYTSYLINMKESEFTLDSKIGIIEDEGEIEGFILAKKILKRENLTNELVYYEDYFEMLYDLYAGEIDAIFIQQNFVELYKNDDMPDLATDINIIYKLSEKREKKEQITSSSKDFTEPMTFLILGVDSDKNSLSETASFNGDVIMLLTFNPKTLNTTMLSIPRDVLAPITCRGNKVYKINSSTGSGTKCAVDTIEALTNIKIDYYVKVNFKGVVDLVDALGGITVDVEKPDFNKYSGKVCEQDSNRRSDNLICFGTGIQTLNGEQALAYSRNRTQYSRSDIDRNVHQQQVLAAIANKVSTLKTLKDFEAVLNTINKNIVTNMEPKVILSSYDIIKRIIINKEEEDSLDVEKLLLEVYNVGVKYSERGGRVSALGYYKDSLDEAVYAMRVNLGLEEPKIIKTFSFSINDAYQKHISGKGKKQIESEKVFKSFIGKTKEDANKFCQAEGLVCEFIVVNSDNNNFNINYGKDIIGSQNQYADKLINKTEKVIFYINGELLITPQLTTPVVEETIPEAEENTNEN